jgi:hypothetical protein
VINTGTIDTHALVSPSHILPPHPAWDSGPWVVPAEEEKEKEEKAGREESLLELLGGWWMCVCVYVLVFM